MSLESLISSMVGFLVPALVDMLRNWRLPCRGPAAVLLAFVTACIVTSVAYFLVDRTPTSGEYYQALLGSFTVAQVVYHRIKDQALKEEAEVAEPVEDDATGEG